MAEETKNAKEGAAERQRGIDEVSLEMMKFIALTTGYGKPSAAGAGFGGKPSKTTSEEYAEALLELFEKCRGVVKNG